MVLLCGGSSWSNGSECWFYSVVLHVLMDVTWFYRGDFYSFSLVLYALMEVSYCFSLWFFFVLLWNSV